MGTREKTIFALIASSLLAAWCSAAFAAETPSVRVSPHAVEVGITFGGADVLVEGTAPAGTQVVVKVSTQPVSVKLSKKDRVLGIFWMTTERAVVENMPAYYAVYASRPLETLLSKDDLVRIGADGECTSVTDRARVIPDSAASVGLSAEQAQAYVVGLRDIYIKNGRYVTCVSCHRARPRPDATVEQGSSPQQGVVSLAGSEWRLGLKLPADAPLGDYEVVAHFVRDSQVVASQSASFSVQKAGLAQVLESMAVNNAPAYGAMSLVLVVLTGLGIGFAFPKSGH